MSIGKKAPAREKYSVSTSASRKRLTLAEHRAAGRFSQKDVVGRLGAAASAASRHGSGNDPSLSTFDRYGQALGGELLLIAVFPDQTGGDIRCRLRVEGPPRPALAQKGRSQAKPAPMRSAPGIRFEQWVKEPERAR